MWPLLTLFACQRPAPVIVVGGGVAGMAAAIEAAAEGPAVLVEGTGALGGATRMAQGITAVPSDDTGDAAWARYVEQVQPQVIDWTGAMGVRWGPAPNPGEDGLALLAPAGGGGALVEALRRQLAGVQVILGHRVESLERADRGFSVGLDDGRAVEGRAVVLATGGFMGDLDQVRARLGLGDLRILRGTEPWADGAGLTLGQSLGAGLADVDRAILYAHGTPDPADPQRALMVTNFQGARVLGTDGTPLGWLGSPRGDLGGRLAATPGGRAWFIADQRLSAHLHLLDVGRGARRLSPRVGLRADDVDALALLIDVPPASLEGLGPPPYAALPLFPTTAKNLGGLDTDLDARVLDEQGRPIPGLFAAGEVTGFGGAYEGEAVDSTMIAGAILTGRVAGRAAAGVR